MDILFILGFASWALLGGILFSITGQFYRAERVEYAVVSIHDPHDDSRS